MNENKIIEIQKIGGKYEYYQNQKSKIKGKKGIFN